MTSTAATDARWKAVQLILRLSEWQISRWQTWPVAKHSTHTDSSKYTSRHDQVYHFGGFMCTDL